MKKILEVLQYGDHEIRFNTDFSETDQEQLPVLIGKIAFTMVTKLWGGNESAVLAMIRALAIADLSVSVNRKEMIRNLDEDSATFARIFKEAQAAIANNGGKVITFPPGFNPTKAAS